MAVLGRGQPVPPVVSRGGLEDPSDLAGRAPVVVAAQPPRRPAGAPLVLRGHLADPDPVVLTTPPPVVVAAPERRRPTYPVVSRSSLVDVVDVDLDARPGPLSASTSAGRLTSSSAAAALSTSAAAGRLTA